LVTFGGTYTIRDLHSETFGISSQLYLILPMSQELANFKYYCNKSSFVSYFKSLLSTFGWFIQKNMKHYKMNISEDPPWNRESHGN